MAAAAGMQAAAFGPMGFFLRRALAAARRVLPAGTEMNSLIYEDPKRLDARRLPLTAVEDFGTMGQTAHPVTLESWRLQVTGAVDRPTELDYGALTRMPALERDVLLICPGVFAFHARWKGLSLRGLLEAAGAEGAANFVEVSGPKGAQERRERFSMEDVVRDGLFLAYGVNGRVLPEKHGYPLRAVAEDQVGSRWVKYVDRIVAVTAEAGTSAPPAPPLPPFLP
jgi:sulfoxide reductase catalytic subunit YedY